MGEGGQGGEGEGDGEGDGEGEGEGEGKGKGPVHGKTPSLVRNSHRTRVILYFTRVLYLWHGKR